MKKFITTGIALVTTSMLLLTACSSGNKGPAAAVQASQGADITKLASYNPQPRENLKQGGELTLSVGTIPSDFNTNDSAGNTSDNSALQAPINQADFGCWKYDTEGTAYLNKDFCTDFKNEINNGQQIMTIEVNPKATWNDGTPIDYKTFQNTWKVRNGSNKDYDLVTTDYWDKISSVVRGKDDKEVIVKTSTPTYPIDSFFYSLLHPAINTPKTFNEAFLGDLHPEWKAGPFKLEKYDSAAKTVTEVPNEKWWGDKPVLDKITFRQLESQATLAAFKNGEIDAAGGGTQTAYAALSGTKNSDMRSGQRTFNGGMLVNPNAEDVKDPEIRKAIFTAVNREELRKVRFAGLNYTEGNPGSMLLLPFAKNYQDNWPIPTNDQGAAKAKEVLKGEGYIENKDGLMEKNGKTAKVSVTNFGDDPVMTGYTKTMIKQLRAGGLDASIDQKASSEFGDVFGKLKYDIMTGGFVSSTGDTTGVKQYYSTDSIYHTGDQKLNERIDKVSSVEDNDQRQKESMNIERDFQKKYYVYGTIFNGPQIVFTKKGLANFGAGVFINSSASWDWTKVGWQK